MSRRDKHIRQQANVAPPPMPTVATLPEKREPPSLKKGARFGRWRLLRDSGVLRSGHRYAPCECVCGTQALVYETHLVSGRSTGCRSKTCRASHGVA